MTVYPMSAVQEAIWLDEALTDGPSRYLESWIYRLTGAVDVAGLDWAYRQLLHRHQGLRSHYQLADDDLVQQVQPAADRPGLARRPCTAAGLEDELRQLVNRPMDLTETPIRGTLLELAGDEVVLVLQVHHIVVDDWALHLIERDFEEGYRAWAERRPIARPAAPQPGPYAQTQGSHRATADVRAYWRQRLGDLPADVVRAPPVGDGDGGRVRFELGSLAAAGRALRATPFVLVAAATAALLVDGAGPAEVLLGVAVSGRGTGGTDRMVACLSQVFPLRLRVDPDRSLAELAADVRREVFALLAHQEIPVADLNRLLRRPAAGAGPPIRTVLVLDDDLGGMDLPGVTAERLFRPSGAAKYDLLLTAIARPGGYRGFLDHAAGRLGADAARRLTERLAALVGAAAADAHEPLKDLLSR